MRWMIAQFFEIRWWKRYLDHQEVDDYLTRKKAYWNQILSICPFQASHGDHILDAGCGPAGIFMNLQSYEVDAVDPLIGQYEQHLAHFSQKSYPNTRFHESPIEEFEVKKTYDIVFCLNVINHVKDIQKAIHRLSQATSEGKWLAISIDTHRWAVFKKLFRAIPADILHPHQYDVGEYQQMLEKSGFEIIETLKLKNGYIFDYHIIFAKKV